MHLPMARTVRFCSDRAMCSATFWSATSDHRGAPREATTLPDYVSDRPDHALGVPIRHAGDEIADGLAACRPWLSPRPRMASSSGRSPLCPNGGLHQTGNGAEALADRVGGQFVSSVVEPLCGALRFPVAQPIAPL